MYCERCEYKNKTIIMLVFLIIIGSLFFFKNLRDISELKKRYWVLSGALKQHKEALIECQEQLNYELTLRDSIRQENGLITTEIVRLQYELHEMRTNPMSWIKDNYKSYNLEVTAYSPSVDECDDDPFIAASGEFVDDFTVAVSQNMRKNGWDFGEFVYIPDHNKFYKINDVMNKRFTKRIDVFKWTKAEAKHFGFCNLDVYPIINPDRIKDRRRVL